MKYEWEFLPVEETMISSSQERFPQTNESVAE